MSISSDATREAADAQPGRLHLPGVTLWAGLMLIVLAGWLSVDERGDRRFHFMAVAGALVSVLGFVAGLRMASGRQLAAWFGMGAAVLLVGAGYAWWDRRSSAYAGVLGGLGVLFGLLGLLRIAYPAAPLANLAAEARSQKRRLACMLLAIGAAMIAGAMYFGVSMGASVLAETLGLALLGIVLVGTGLVALAPDDAGRGTRAPWGRGMGLGLCIVALVLFGTAFYLGASLHSESNILKPEAVTLGTAALLLAGMGLLFLSDAKPETLRETVPILGALLGFILIVGAFIWLSAQPEQLRQGGLGAWRGEDSWRHWVAAYQILIGLMMPVLAFMLTSGVAAQEETASRRSLARLQAAVALVMAIAFVVVLNVFLYSAATQSYSWTKGRGFYSISDASKRLLSNLKEPVTFYVIPHNQDAFIASKNMLDNMRAESNLVSVEFVDPTRGSLFTTLRQRYPKLGQVPFGILIAYGAETGKAGEAPRHAFIAEDKFFKRDSKSSWSYRGEQEVLSEMKLLLRNESGEEAKRFLYFLQGHGELDLAEENPKVRKTFQSSVGPMGSGQLAGILKIEQHSVKGLSFDAPPAKAGPGGNVVYLKKDGVLQEIPDDCSVLVVLGPSEPIPLESLQTLDNYLKRGGKMLACLDVFADKDYGALRRTGLEGLLRKYGVNVEDDFILRLTKPSPFQLDAKTAPGGTTALSGALAEQQFLLPLLSRIVSAQKTPKFRADPLLAVGKMADGQSVQEVIPERDVNALRDPLRHLQTLERAGELQKRMMQNRDLIAGVAVVEEGESDGAPKTSVPRLVVLGDAELFSNAGMLKNAAAHYDLFVNAIDWLQDRPTLSGVLPRDMGVFNLRPTTNIGRMVGMPMWLMLLCIVGLGTCLWIVRRLNGCWARALRISRGIRS